MEKQRHDDKQAQKQTGNNNCELKRHRENQRDVQREIRSDLQEKRDREKGILRATERRKGKTKLRETDTNTHRDTNTHAHVDANIYNESWVNIYLLTKGRCQRSDADLGDDGSY